MKLSKQDRELLLNLLDYAIIAMKQEKVTPQEGEKVAKFIRKAEEFYNRLSSKINGHDVKNSI